MSARISVPPIPAPQRRRGENRLADEAVGADEQSGSTSIAPVDASKVWPFFRLSHLL